MLTIGADPEFVLTDRNGNPVSSEGKIGGSKTNPRFIKKFGYQEDNIIGEFSMPPANTEDMFVTLLKEGIDIISEELLKQDLNVSIISSAEFKQEETTTDQGRSAGCDPEFCVYTQSYVEPPDYENSLVRTAGGHIHVGWLDPKSGVSPDVNDCERIVKNMDYFLGIPSVILDPDARRRQYYGKAGSFRFTDYGIEYRTLSNFWIKEEKLVRWAFKNTEQAFNYKGDLPAGIREIIDNNLVSEAERIIKLFNIQMP